MKEQWYFSSLQVVRNPSMTHTSYNEIHKHRLDLIKSCKVKIVDVRKKPLTFAEFTNALIGSNKCATLFNMQEGKFISWYKVKELLGYDKNEFNHEAINNIGEIKIIHPDDYEHVHRYDTIIYSILLGSNNTFGILSDNYILNFRMIDKNGKTVSIRRTSYVFDVDKANKPLIQLDTWEKNNRYKSNNTFPDLILTSEDLSELLTNQFYKRNLKVLNLSFGNNALRVLQYKMMGYTNKWISNTLNITIQSVANTHNRNFANLRDRFSTEISKIEIHKAGHDKRKNIKVFETICRQYGLYPIPIKILNLDYKRKGS